jgi:hypothetical protein
MENFIVEADSLSILSTLVEHTLRSVGKHVAICLCPTVLHLTATVPLLGRGASMMGVWKGMIMETDVKGDLR